MEYSQQENKKLINFSNEMISLSVSLIKINKSKNDESELMFKMPCLVSSETTFSNFIKSVFSSDTMKKYTHFPEHKQYKLFFKVCDSKFREIKDEEKLMSEINTAKYGIIIFMNLITE